LGSSLAPTLKFIWLACLPGTAANGPNILPVPIGGLIWVLITSRLEPSLNFM
jgi:hypothetical protein